MMMRLCNFTDEFSNWFPDSEKSLVSGLKFWQPPVSRPTQLTSPPASPPQFASASFGNKCLVVISNSCWLHLNMQLVCYIDTCKLPHFRITWTSV